MGQATWTVTDAQLQASAHIADAITTVLTTEHGVHAETAVAAAGRMAGTFLFRSFGLPTSDIPPGTPVLSDASNERGPLLVQTLQAGLSGLGLDMAQLKVAVEPSPTHQPHLGLLETQRTFEPPLNEIASTYRLASEPAAHACALAAALVIYRARSALEPSIGFRLALDGFVEGSKTMPAPLSPTPKPRP